MTERKKDLAQWDALHMLRVLHSQFSSRSLDRTGVYDDTPEWLKRWAETLGQYDLFPFDNGEQWKVGNK